MSALAVHMGHMVMAPCLPCRFWIDTITGKINSFDSYEKSMVFPKKNTFRDAPPDVAQAKKFLQNCLDELSKRYLINIPSLAMTLIDKNGVTDVGVIKA